MTAAPSPLFEPVLWDGCGFRILDETQIPETIEYLEIEQVEQAIDAVRLMKTRAFGQVLAFLYSGALVAEQYAQESPQGLRRRLEQMTKQFSAARPTFDFPGLLAFFQNWLIELPPDSRPGRLIAQHARELAQRIVLSRSSRARRAASLLPDPARVLTHCNLSGELVAVAQFCRELGKQLSVIATETRPYLQGTRLTAWELARAGVPVSIISDNAVAQVMEDGKVNAVLVGADRAAQNGDIVNKVGTYPLALMARDFGVPFYALVQDPRSLARGDDVSIEERPATELLAFQGKPLIESPTAALHVRYPAFDVTPAALITRWVGFDDIYTAETFLQKYQKTVSDRRHNLEGVGRYILLYGVPPESQYSFLSRALALEQAETLLVPEMRPELWGTELVVPALLQRAIATTVIADSMMGTLFAQGAIKKLYLFYDALTERGVRAICGAQLTARLAHSHRVPVELFQAAGDRPSTPDRDAGTFLGRQICPPGVMIHPSGPELIPWPLLKTIP